MKDQENQLDVVIFCGGRGTRLSEKTREMPKPLIELGESPILWHIMKIYSQYNYSRFLLTLGYKGDMIVDYFINRLPTSSNFSINTSDIKVPQSKENWDVQFIQTGIDSKTSKRLAFCRDYLSTDTFMITYGDGVADIDIGNLVKTHRYLKETRGVIATITITRPYSKYGIVKIEDHIVRKFREKPLLNDYVNVGFIVAEKEIFEYVERDGDVMFEETLENIANDGKLGCYIHDGFWHAMDTYKDYVDLNEMWNTAPKWKIWTE
jgi:glucose-1-phosphate cytidylyltransferase